MLISRKSQLINGRRRYLAAAILIAAVACGSDSTGPAVSNPPSFLDGTSTNHEIGLVVNSIGKTLTLFQLGRPATQKQIAFGSSSAVTPTGFSMSDDYAAVPLGNAASVALVNLRTMAVARYFTFPSGNATGSAFVDDTTIIAANTTLGTVGRMTVGQNGDAIVATATVAPQPTDVKVGNGRVLVTSSNLDDNFAPIGNGIVTILDPGTLAVLATVSTGGINSTAAALGPDGLLYVVNTGDYSSQGSLTIVNPSTMQAVTTIPDIGVGPGAISIDANGLAYISGFSFGTIIWDTRTRTFVRGASNPVCARLQDNSCRGAFAATSDAAGDVYQLFFGSTTLSPYAFVFKAGTFALADSVSVGTGPAAIAIRTF